MGESFLDHVDFVFIAQQLEKFFVFLNVFLVRFILVNIEDSEKDRHEKCDLNDNLYSWESKT